MAKKYGHWLVKNTIDEGGQAHVFCVTREGGDDTLFALKRLKNSSRLDRFEKEINAVKKLTSRYIVEIVDCDVASAAPFYVMPFYPAGNAEKALMQTASPSAKLDFFEKILQGMESAHRAGVIHRDLKPQNILVTGDWEPVIADFGICYVEGGERCTYTEEVVGNRDFSAPEVLEGRQQDVSARSDVYSLGKLLYWLLAGRILPRERYREPGYDLKVVLGDTQFEAFTRLLDRSVTEKPDDRLADAAELLDAFGHMRELVRLGANTPSPDIDQRCIYCRDGFYQVPPHDTHPPDGSSPDPKNAAGITASSSNRFRVMICDSCGNVQVFKVGYDNPPGLKRNPWKRAER